MKDLTQKEWREQAAADENAILLDVRTNEEIEQGQIPNSKNLNIQDAGTFMDGTNEMDKTKNYYVYCRAGSRSVQACLIMESLGFQNTFNLLGGFSEWEGEKTL